MRRYKNMRRISCIVFLLEYFKECSSLEQVKETNRLDFNLNEGIPGRWYNSEKRPGKCCEMISA